MPEITEEPGRLTLATAPVGLSYVVLRLRTEPGLTRRLGAFGLRPGAQVEILQRASGGGRVVGVAGARVALDRQVLQAVDAEEVAG